MNNTFSIEGKVVQIDGISIFFDRPIHSYIEMSGMLIILLQHEINMKQNEGVFGISLSEKKIKWHISNKKKFFPGNMKNCPFTAIVNYEDQLLLNNWCDFYLIVNPLSGKIIEERQAK